MNYLALFIISITSSLGRAPTPVNQVAKVTVPEPRMIMIQPWEKSILHDIEVAIMKSDLGLNPNSDGTAIRLVPQIVYYIAAFGMSMLQEMGDLIAVFGVDDHLKGIGRFLLRFHGPAFCVGTRALRSVCGYLGLDGFPGFSHSGLDIRACRIGILLQPFHDGFGQLIDRAFHAHCRTSFLQRILISRLL